MKTFENFMNPTTPEKGKLYIEEDDGQYDENWAYTLDVTKIWQDFTNQSITLLDFNNEYASLLMEHQQNISSSVGDACWNEIEPIVSNELRAATNEDDSETIYNKLYDVFDRFDVYVETGKIQENNEIPTEV